MDEAGDAQTRVWQLSLIENGGKPQHSGPGRFAQYFDSIAREPT